MKFSHWQPPTASFSDKLHSGSWWFVAVDVIAIVVVVVGSGL